MACITKLKILILKANIALENKYVRYVRPLSDFLKRGQTTFSDAVTQYRYLAKNAIKYSKLIYTTLHYLVFYSM